MSNISSMPTMPTMQMTTTLNDQFSLLAISPLDGRYHDKITCLRDIVSEFGLIKYRLYVELEWFKYLCTLPEFIANYQLHHMSPLSASDVIFLDKIYTEFTLEEAIEVKQIERTTNHDVKAIEYFIKNKLATSSHLASYSELVHFACTSEDINNLSYALMLKDARSLLLNNGLLPLAQAIEGCAHEYRHVAMMSRTHGQPASPTTLGKEFYNVYYRLNRQLSSLTTQELLGKINGAVGNYNAHVVCYPNIAWNEVAKNFVEQKLGLSFNPFTTQIEPHDYIAEYLGIINRINVILLDFSRDMWGYIALNYFKQRLLANEVGSSTMPHKVNPIDFENAEGNLGLANALATHLAEKLPISRFQRDLSDSTTLRTIGSIFGYTLLAVLALNKGLAKLELHQDTINHDLDNNLELLAEPIQMVMRKANMNGAYEQLKTLTRGKKITQEELSQFIAQLDLPDDDKKRLLTLTTHKYYGLANKLF